MRFRCLGLPGSTTVSIAVSPLRIGLMILPSTRLKDDYLEDLHLSLFDSRYVNFSGAECETSRVRTP